MSQEGWVSSDIKPRALTLLAYMVQVQEWALTGDERADEFIKADAIRVNDGKVSFHRDRFGEMFIRILATRGEA